MAEQDWAKVAEKGPAAVKPLLVCLQEAQHNDPHEVADVASAMLQKIGAEAAEILYGCLNDKDKYLRIKAAETLAQLNDARGREYLENCLKDEDKDVRRWATEALEASK